MTRQRLADLAIGVVVLLSACSSPATPPAQPALFLFRFNPPGLLEYSEALQLVREYEFPIPRSCGLNNTFAPAAGGYLAVELTCPNGPTVLFLDLTSGRTLQPITAVDSHFLAWAADGRAAFLRVDALGNPRVMRVQPDGRSETLAIDPYTYDLAARPNTDDFSFAVSHGLGQGSELWLARRGRPVQPLYVDRYNYLSFAAWSPDGSQLAFLKVPDSQTPFTVGELWLLAADGSGARKLVDADAGHGFMASWSPDGTRLAFVRRENPDEAAADQSSAALRSNLYLFDLATNGLTQLTRLPAGYVETPHWSPAGNSLAFNVVIDGRMNVSIADHSTGEVKPLSTEVLCCPVWMSK